LEIDFVFGRLAVFEPIRTSRFTLVSQIDRGSDRVLGSVQTLLLRGQDTSLPMFGLELESLGQVAAQTELPHELLHVLLESSAFVEGLDQMALGCRLSQSHVEGIGQFFRDFGDGRLLMSEIFCLIYLGTVHTDLVMDCVREQVLDFVLGLVQDLLPQPLHLLMLGGDFLVVWVILGHGLWLLVYQVVVILAEGL